MVLGRRDDSRGRGSVRCTDHVGQTASGRAGGGGICPPKAQLPKCMLYLKGPRRYESIGAFQQIRHAGCSCRSTGEHLSHLLLPWNACPGPTPLSASRKHTTVHTMSGRTIMLKPVSAVR